MIRTDSCANKIDFCEWRTDSFEIRPDFVRLGQTAVTVR